MIDTPYGRKTPELLTAAMDAYTAMPEILEHLKAIEVVLKDNKLANVGNSTIHYALCKTRAAIAQIEELPRQP